MITKKGLKYTPKAPSAWEWLHWAKKQGLDVYGVTPEGRPLWRWTKKLTDGKNAEAEAEARAKLYPKIMAVLKPQRDKIVQYYHSQPESTGSLWSKAQAHVRDFNEMVNAGARHDPVFGQLVPQSLTGKALAIASLPTGGEAASVLGSMAKLGATGAVAGEASGEGPIQGGLEGAGLGILGGLPGLPKAARNVYRNMTLRELESAAQSDSGRIGQAVFDTLHSVLPPNVSKRITRGIGNDQWFYLLRDPSVSKAVGQYYRDGMDHIGADLDTWGAQKAQEAEDAFVKKYGFSPRTKLKPGSVVANHDMLADYYKTRGQMAEFRNTKQKFFSMNREIQNAEETAFGKGAWGETPDQQKPGLSAKQAAETFHSLRNQQEALLDQVGQDLHNDIGQRFRSVLDNYSKYKAWQEIAQNVEPVTTRIRLSDNRLIERPDSGRLMLYLRNNQERLYNRLKDGWDTAKDAITNHTGFGRGFNVEQFGSQLPGSQAPHFRTSGSGWAAYLNPMKWLDRSIRVGETPPPSSRLFGRVARPAAALLGPKIPDLLNPPVPQAQPNQGAQ